MAESLWRRVFSPGRGPGRPPEDPGLPRVLALTTCSGDHTFYTLVREKHEWDIVIANTVREALCLLAAQPFSIVLCDRDLQGWDWREVLTRISGSSPGICVLLTSRVSDDFLWQEVVALGGYDVVARPLTEQALTQTLRRAMYYRKTEPRPPGALAKT